MIAVCKQCNTVLGAADIDLEHLTGKCPACATLFDLSDRVGEGSKQQRRRAAVPLPRGVSLRDGSGRLVVVRRWFRPIAHPLLLLLAVVWNGALVLFLMNAREFTVLQPAPAWVLLFMVIGAVLVYFALAGLLNRTLIEVGGKTLSIRHTPLPWTGNRELETHRLKTLCCEPQAARWESSETVYHLGAIDDIGRKTRLVSNLGNLDQALYLEQRIEERLGIADVEPRPAAG